MLFQLLLQHGVRCLHRLGHRFAFLVHLHVFGRIVRQTGVTMGMPCGQQLPIPLMERGRMKRQREIEEREGVRQRVFR